MAVMEENPRQDRFAAEQGLEQGQRGEDEQTLRDETSPVRSGTGFPSDEKLSDEQLEAAGSRGNEFDSGSGKTYRNMGRWDTTFVLLTNQVGIGILSLPSVTMTLGIVPAILAIAGLGLVSYYTAYELLQFYLAHPHCVNMVDMCRVVGGRPFEIVGSVMLLLTICFTCSSASVTMSIALNSITNHSVCTLGFVGIAVLACWAFCLPRTFKVVGYVGIPAAGSIVVALLIVIISLAIESPTQAEPGWTKEIKVVGNPTFREGLGACLRVCYAYAGNIGFPSYMAEMKNPRKDFVPAIIWLQTVSVAVYVAVAVSIYCLAAQHTSSPAIGSAPIVPAKVAYGFALFALVSTGMVFGHTAIKYLYVSVLRAMKKTHVATEASVRSWAYWIACGTAFWVVVFIVANAIPVFDSILSVSSAVLTAWSTFGISAVFWLHLNKGRWFSTTRKTVLTVVNLLIILQTLFMNAAGLWAAITGLMDIFADPDNNIDGSFTCADNSIF